MKKLVKGLLILFLAIGLIGCSSKKDEDIVSNNDQSNQGELEMIKPEEAYDIYLKKYPDFKVKSLKLETEMKKQIYEVEGFLDNSESEVNIDAISGEIINDKSEKDLNNNKAEILREDVIKVNNLLQDALADGESELREWALEYDNKILELEVEIIKGMSSIERTYNVATSQVIEIDN